MNTPFRTFWTASAICLGAWLSWNSHAQNSHDHQHQQGAAQPALSDGEVRKVDAENGKVTIKHGDIPHLDMPSMTMVFTVKDKNMLTHIKSGDKVRFLVIQERGKLLVTDIQTQQ